MQQSVRKYQNTALVLAGGGSSTRFGHGNKLLQDLGGMPLFLHAISAAAPVLGNQNIYMAVPESEKMLFKDLQLKYLPGVNVQLVTGGKSRAESVYRALTAIQDPAITIAAVQDAARPFLSSALLQNCIDACQQYGGAVACHKICDTVKKSASDGMVACTVPRDDLWAAETPQVFYLKDLVEAYEQALRSAENFTDEAQVMERFSKIRCKIVENKAFNGKITYYEDLLQ